MDKIIDKFVLFVFKNPEEDVLDLFNRFVYSLSPDEQEKINDVIPLVIESGAATREAPEKIQQIILDEISKKM